MSTEQDIIKDVLTRAIMLRVGQRAVFIIKKRIAEGIFGDGSTAGKSYSTRPFVMPVGAIQKKSVMMDILKGKYGKDTQLFVTKAGKKWVLITKGYQWLRQKSGKPSDQVDFRWTGELSRSLGVLNADPATGEITIGHKGKRNEDIAKWWNVEGAGKGKKLRKWLYLTDDELKKLAEDFK